MDLKFILRHDKTLIFLFQNLTTLIHVKFESIYNAVEDVAFVMNSYNCCLQTYMYRKKTMAFDISIRKSFTCTSIDLHFIVPGISECMMKILLEWKIVCSYKSDSEQMSSLP